MTTSDEAITVGGTTALNSSAAAETLTILGNQDLTFTGAVTADTIDASGFTKVLTLTGGMAAQATITGGSGGDTLRGSTSADIINGGAGNDTIRGDDASDQLTGGAGNDTFDMDNGDTDEASTVVDIITDFDAATSTTSADVLLLDITSIEALDLSGGGDDLVDTSANSMAATDNTYAALSADGATVANADIVGIIGDYANAAAALAAKTSWTITFGANLADNNSFLVAYDSGDDVKIAVVCNNSGGAAASSDTCNVMEDIVQLQDVSLANLNSSDFNTQ
jgi:Ca2+-binding RTX toxin-like protein